MFEGLKQRAVAAIVNRGQEFTRGWAEGVGRWNNRRHGVIEGSRFDKGTTAFAASQGAVAFCEGLEK